MHWSHVHNPQDNRWLYSPSLWFFPEVDFHRKSINFGWIFGISQDFQIFLTFKRFKRVDITLYIVFHDVRYLSSSLRILAFFSRLFKGDSLFSFSFSFQVLTSIYFQMQFCWGQVTVSKRNCFAPNIQNYWCWIQRWVLRSLPKKSLQFVFVQT
jgi:hypothetical protein